jgi:hypothetical protein
VADSTKQVIIVRLATSTREPWSLDTAARLPLGSATNVRGALEKVFGVGDWATPDKGLFDHDGCSLEATIGIHEQVDSMTLDFWKQGDPMPAIQALCIANGWKAWDSNLWQPIGGDGGPKRDRLP